jgi:hypothetical protein
LNKEVTRRAEVAGVRAFLRTGGRHALNADSTIRRIGPRQRRSNP